MDACRSARVCLRCNLRIDDSHRKRQIYQKHFSHLSILHNTSKMESKPMGSYPKTGIEVHIIGTGFAGLTAALECTRKGHSVRIIERNETADYAGTRLELLLSLCGLVANRRSGDMYFQGISAMSVLKHWPEMAEEYERNSLAHAWIETFKHDGDRMFAPHKIGERLHADGLPPGVAPGSFQMRPLMYNMFLRQAEKLGIPIEYGKRVVDYFETSDKGGVELEGGEKYEADIVVAADGVGSKSQKLVGGPVRARSSGRAMWRAVFPISHIDKKSAAREFFRLHEGTEPIVRTFLGYVAPETRPAGMRSLTYDSPGTYGLTLTKDDQVVWIVNHDVSGNEAETWHQVIDAEEVLAQMDDIAGPTKWSPIIKDLVACTPPGTIVNFELWWRDPQENWYSPEARVVQIGDSAHSFLPSSGSGATQAIEDAVSLASCLQIGGVENVPQSVQPHRRLR